MKDRSTDRPNAMTQTLSVATLGDCLLTRRLRHVARPGFLQVRRILSRSDVVVGNLEVPLHRLDALPAAQRTDFPVVADPALTDDLAFMGFDLMATANNHMCDYGTVGVLSTMDHLTSRGILFSGAGCDLAAARRAAVLHRRAARFGLLACATTFDPGTDARNAPRPRAGVNPLVLTRRERPAGAIARALSAGRRDAAPAPLPASPGLRGWIRYGVSPSSSRAVLRSVRLAAARTDVVVVSVHSHEAEGDERLPPACLRRFGKACIDAGASAVVMHGPHVIRGAELHRGRPIFYGLGNFVFQPHAVATMPEGVISHLLSAGDRLRAVQRWLDRPELWRSILPILRYRAGQLVEFTVHPIVIRRGGTRASAGVPELAGGRRAAVILREFGELAGALGTRCVESRAGLVVRGETP